jgi:hypothetical protein
MPVPVLLTVMACDDGFEPPAVALKESDPGESPIAGSGAAVTVTTALADAVGSATDVAITWKVPVPEGAT